MVPQIGPAQQIPWLHDSPAPQAWPQLPQFDASTEVFTQAPEQLVQPEGQHLPALHAWPPGQTLLQAPQFEESVEVLTQAPEQFVQPEGQHLPALHE